MKITQQDILEDFGKAAKDHCAACWAESNTMTPCDEEFLGVCERLTGMLDTMLDIVEQNWSNTDRIEDMWMFLTPDVRTQMEMDNHPFYQAWLSLQ